MKAIVLAGGHATRLWPLTKNRAKPLLPLGDRPILHRVMEDLEDIGSIDEVLISTNRKYSEKFERFVDESGFSKGRVLVEEHEEEGDKPGSLGAIIQVIEEEGEDDYLVVAGDNYSSLDVESFLGFARERGAITVACFSLPGRKEAAQFGVVSTEGDRITGFEEKPEEPESSLISTAYYYFPEDSMEIFEEYGEMGGGGDRMDEPGRLIEWGHSRFEMYAFPFEGYWYDIGTPENYLRALSEVEDVREGEVENAEIGENVFLMGESLVKNSGLENCVVFEGAEIVDSELRGTIVDRDVRVEGKELDSSVIGEHSRLR